MADGEGKRIGVFGKSGSGKSHLVKTMIRDYDRVVVVDPEEEYDSLPGFTRIDNAEALLAHLRERWQDDFRVAYVPEPGRERLEAENAAQILVTLQNAYKNGTLTRGAVLVVDELATCYPIHQGDSVGGGMDAAVSRGRKRGLTVIGVTQRPAEIPTRFRGNLDRIISFRFSTPHDVRAVTGAVGDGAVGEAVQRLEDYQFVRAAGGTWSICDPV